VIPDVWAPGGARDHWSTMSRPVTARVIAAHRGARSSLKLYRATPPALRRPEPAARLGALAATIWFGGFFVTLGVLVTRLDHHPAPLGISVLAWGYFAAASLAVLGSALVFAHRYRAGFGALGSMLALAQLATVAAVV
jgi:hypothetical protein